jgi:predicted DNA-binding transcriptional regulator AlpA
MFKPIIAIAVLIAFASAVFMSGDTAAILSPIAAMLSKPTAAMALAMSATAAEPLAYTIREFCRAHGISVPTFYEFKKQGLGPTEMRMGAVIRISREAAAAWRQARENPAKAEAEAATRSAEVLRNRARRAAKRAVESPKHVSRRGADIA